MSDLLSQFASPALALAAYNAGPAPVAACGCVPGYPETQAYVAGSSRSSTAPARASSAACRRSRCDWWAEIVNWFVGQR